MTSSPPARRKDLGYTGINVAEETALAPEPALICLTYVRASNPRQAKLEPLARRQVPLEKEVRRKQW
jgi:hypothetical protein